MIVLNDISKEYETKNGRLYALKSVSLHVPRGKIFGVIGRSGAGKSTLLRCVNLLERPSSGRVRVNGREMTKLTDKELRLARHEIGMIFQHFNLFNARNVYKNVAFPLELLKFSKTEIEKKVRPLLELVGLENKMKAYPHQLSGGQKQRVAIARALATEPKVLLCDEMTSSLDPETTDAILKLIQEINQEMQLSVLLITHEMDVVRKIADRVAVLDHGEIVEQSGIIELFESPKTTVGNAFVNSLKYRENGFKGAAYV
jgi:D-methionine transport system ATP-binding protein